MDVDQVSFGAFRLDQRQRTLWRDGVPVDLGGRAADILCALVAARGALVSKDALIAEAWPGQVVEENTLQAQVSGLRKALGPDQIVTVPGRGYRLAGATPAAAALPWMRGRPSLAVLAFDNLSGDPADGCFADGMAEDLITELSRSRSWLVVSRNSSFTYKGRRVDIRQVGRELGVRYVLEGSIRRAGNRIRVTAHLTEAEAGVHVWAERYDRALADLFETQDDITGAVARAIGPAVDEAEQMRALHKRPEGLDAWEAWHRAQSCIDAEDWDNVDVWLRRSIALDPRFAPPHASRAFTLWSSAVAGRAPFAETRAAAEAASRHAIRLDPDDPLGHSSLSLCLDGMRDWDGAVLSAARSVALGPSAWGAHCSMTLAQAGAGSLVEAAQHLDLLHQIGPRGSGRRITLLLDAYLHFLRGDYEAAAAGAEGLIAAHPRYSHPHWVLIASLGHLGRRQAAAGPLRRWLSTLPDHAVQVAERGVTWLAQGESERVLEGLRAAGWED